MIQQLISNLQLPEGYQVTMGGSTQYMNSSFKYLGYMITLAIVRVYMISQFESLYGTFVIMFSLSPKFIDALNGLAVSTE